MNRGAVRRLISVASVVALVALPLALSLGASGCKRPDPFSARHCKINDKPRVTANRVVYLYAKNYIYESSTASPADLEAYSRTAEIKIDGAYEVANRIFAQDAINLQLVPSTEEVVNDGMDIARPNSPLAVDIPEGFVVQKMAAVHKQWSQLIGVQWAEWNRFKNDPTAPSWGSPPAPCRSFYCDWVLMTGSIHNIASAEEIGRTLAHELGHYFSLSHVLPTDNLPDNLMVTGGSGTALTAQQRDTMWDSVNNRRTPLFAVTCDPPAGAPPLRPAFKPVPTLG